MDFFKKLFGSGGVSKTKKDLGIERCGVCGVRTGKLTMVEDKKNNTGYFCQECITHWEKHLAPDSGLNFFLCSNCGFKIFASGQVDKSGTCSECDGDLNNTYTNLENDKPIGRGIMTC